MTISFNQIPAGIRVPLFYAEFDNSRAVQGSPSQPHKVLMIGTKLAAGTVAALVPSLITSIEQAQEYFGVGSLLADMAETFLKGNKTQPLTCVALDENVAGVKATGKITFTGTPTKAGTASFMIGGRNIQIAVSLVSTPTTIAAALVAAINAETRCLVSAVVNGVNAFEVDLTAKSKGEHGNEIDVRHSYFAGEALPAGIAAAITAMNGGTANPDVDSVWTVVGDTQYLSMVSPYTDSQNIGKMEAELANRFGPLTMNDGYAHYGKRGSLSTLLALGDSRNSQFTVIMASLGPSSPWQFAAALAAQVAASAEIDPARPFQTLPMVGILAPKESELFTLQERDLLLHDGISTFIVDSGSNVLVEGVITTFQENAFGSPDTSYLYLNTPLTLSLLRFQAKARITSKYGRHKLANDGTRFGAGQAIVTPNVIKAEFIALFREWEEAGLVEGFDQFKSELIVERNASNPNRLDVLLPPDLVNQLIVVGTKIQFLL